MSDQEKLHHRLSKNKICTLLPKEREILIKRSCASWLMNTLKRGLLAEGSIADLGGSLTSNTALRGHNDIDLRILLPEEYATEEKIRAISSAIKDIVPFQKVLPVGSPGNEKFAVMHQLKFEKEEIEGGIETEASVRPAEGYIGFAKFQSTFP